MKDKIKRKIKPAKVKEEEVKPIVEGETEPKKEKVTLPWQEYLALLCVVIVIAALIYFFVKAPPVCSGPNCGTNSTINNTINGTTNNTINTTGGDTAHPEINLSEYPALEKRLQNYQALKISHRQNYFGEANQKIMYKYLPPLPTDFYWIKEMFSLAILNDLDKIGPEYYKQPEFYPRFESLGVSMIINASPDRFGSTGFGTYPSEVILVANVNDTTGVETRAWTSIQAGWIVETYQGIKFKIVFPATGSLNQNSFPDGTRAVNQGSDASKYFEVSFIKADPKCSRGTYNAAINKCEWKPDVLGECYSILNVTTGMCSYTAPPDDTILLEPAFPVFQSGWAQKVGMDIKVKPGTPKGKYLIALDLQPPDNQLSQTWTSEYKFLYVPGGSYSIGYYFYAVGISVE